MLAAPGHVIPAGQSGTGTADPNTWITDLHKNLAACVCVLCVVCVPGNGN